MSSEPKIEVKTRARINGDGDAEMLLSFVWLPRGSGNKRRVREMAAYVRGEPELAPWLKRMVVGTSKLTMVFRPGFGLMLAFDRIAKKRRDVDGQMPLFATK